jgi:hypothetical protein
MIRKSALAGWKLHAGLFGIVWLAFAALLSAWKASVYAEAVWVKQFLALQAPTAACYWWFAAACCTVSAIVGSAVMLVQMRRSSGRGRHAFIQNPLAGKLRE